MKTLIFVLSFFYVMGASAAPVSIQCKILGEKIVLAESDSRVRIVEQKDIEISRISIHAEEGEGLRRSATVHLDPENRQSSFNAYGGAPFRLSYKFDLVRKEEGVTLFNTTVEISRILDEQSGGELDEARIIESASQSTTFSGESMEGQSFTMFVDGTYDLTPIHSRAIVPLYTHVQGIRLECQF